MNTLHTRRMLQAAMLMLWGFMLLLGLETIERGRLWYGERIYERQFNAQNARVYGMAPAANVASTLAQWRKAQEETQPPNHNSTPAPERPKNDPNFERQEQRRLFASLSEENRNTILTLEGKLVMRFTRDGRILSSHGAPALEQGLWTLGAHTPPADDVWTPILAAVKNAEGPEVLEIRKFLGPLSFYRVSIAPLQSAGGAIQEVEVVAEDITREKSLEERCNGNVPPEDSRWEITFHSLKKNWRRPDDIMTSNNVGFRDHDVILPKPADVYRIVCIGGSTTEEGNSVDATYPNILEQKLRAWFNTDRIDVVNCGIMGMNSYTMRQRIQDYLNLEPDLILYYGPVNDITHLNFPLWLEQTHNWQQRLGWSKLLSRWMNRKFLPPDDVLAQYLNATSYRNIRALNYAAREQGADMAVVSFAYPTLKPWNILSRSFYDINLREVWSSQGMLTFKTYCQMMALHNRLIQQVCRYEEMTYIPLAEEFHAGPEAFFDVCHMTPLGLEIKTDVIGKHVAHFLAQNGIFTAPK